MSAASEASSKETLSTSTLVLAGEGIAEVGMQAVLVTSTDVRTFRPIVQMGVRRALLY